MAVASGTRLGGSGTATLPSYRKLTFRRGTIWNARFAPDGQTVVCSASWNGNPIDIFTTRAGSTESRSLGLQNADVLAVSSSGEMAVLLNRHFYLTVCATNRSKALTVSETSAL